MAQVNEFPPSIITLQFFNGFKNPGYWIWQRDAVRHVAFMRPRRNSAQSSKPATLGHYAPEVRIASTSERNFVLSAAPFHLLANRQTSCRFSGT